MNFFKLVLKPLAIVLLAVGMNQAAFAMENPINKKLLEAVSEFNVTKAESRYNFTKVQSALNDGADINCIDKYGRTPLHLVCDISGDLEIAKLLLKRGANINSKDEYGYTPLHGASSRYYADLAKLLLEQGANINSKNEVLGNTPLHIAAVHRRLDPTKLLLECGADINCKNKYGETALGEAKLRKYNEIIQVITEESKKRENGKQEKFKALCNKQALEYLNRNNNAKDPKNLDALMPFAKNRDKQQKQNQSLLRSLLNSVFYFCPDSA